MPVKVTLLIQWTYCYGLTLIMLFGNTRLSYLAPKNMIWETLREGSFLWNI